ncbi:alpha/beta hydrolase [Actinoplanes sp. NPDC051343]|uniref:alpha/beta hydrolase n=1 Tax=Actinoplanes sp. NPDC051343 TaxID=3363906 RepID=UPI003788CEDC
MRAWTRPLPVALLTITTVLAYGVPQTPAQAALAPVISWKACPEDAKVQCGTMKVPADWSDPGGPTASIAIARRAATDPAHRIGELLVNPGGPGGSAVDMVLNASGFFTSTLTRYFDLVGMDPRGVGRSAPVLCSQDLVDAAPSPLIETKKAYDDTVAYNRKLAADCAQHTGPVFAHVDTASVARDMDAVRNALKAGQISFYGASYGTLLGEQYNQMFPGRLRALVLDSVMDHSVGVDDFLTQETDAAQDSFEQFIAWCSRDVRCVVRGQDIRALWAGLMARARAGTLLDPYDHLHKLRLSDLLAAAFAAFYDPQWYSFAYYLRDAQALRPEGRKATPDLTDHSFPAVFCADWKLPAGGFTDYQARLRALAARAPQILASPLAVTATSGCLGWPNRPAAPQAPLTPSPIPTLLVNAAHDPATAYAWAAHVTRELGPKAVLLRYRGWGHVAYSKTKCVSGLVDHYLITLDTPAPGTTCKPVEPEPFGVG